MRPQMTKVVSSNVHSVGYDFGSETLHVDFNDGSRYRYFDVPEAVYDAFLAAPSKGSFVWTTLRDRYRYERMA